MTLKSAQGLGDRVLQSRKSGYIPSLAKAHYVATQQTPGTERLLGTIGAFDDLDPMIILDLAADAGKIVIPGTLTLWQSGTIAGGDITIVVAIENKIRLASGGTLIDVKNLNLASVTANDPSGAVTINPVANAETATRVIKTITTPAALGEGIEIDFEDDAHLPALAVGASFLVYAQAATVAPTFDWELDWIEETT